MIDPEQRIARKGARVELKDTESQAVSSVR